MTRRIGVASSWANAPVVVAALALRAGGAMPPGDVTRWLLRESTAHSRYVLSMGGVSEDGIETRSRQALPRFDLLPPLNREHVKCSFPRKTPDWPVIERGVVSPGVPPSSVSVLRTHQWHASDHPASAWRHRTS